MTREGGVIMKAIFAAVMLLAAAASPLGDPMARFSYSAPLAERMNTHDSNAGLPLFFADDAKGRELGDRHLLDAIQALIRVFPACGNRQLQFAYAYGEDATTQFFAFSQPGVRAAKCPGTAVVSLSPTSGAVTVRSLPEA